MRLYTLPLLVTLAVAAHAASLPRHAVAVTDLEKKLTKVVEEVLKKDPQSEENSAEQELAEEANAVVEVDNQLKRVQGIPVKVVEEEVKPSLKKDYGIEKGDAADAAGENVVSTIKRQEVDLEHPGEPQRQEHDTQTPQDSNIEQDTIFAIKQSLAETQNAFKQGFEGLATKFQGVFQTNEQLVTIQKSLENLQNSFSRHFEQINNNLKGYFSAEKPAAEPEKEASIEEAEKNLEVLEEKVEHEIKSLNKVVPEVSAVRASPFQKQSNSSGGGFNPQVFQQYWTDFQTNIQNYFGQFQQSIQGMMSNQTQGAPAPPSIVNNGIIQSDEGTTQRPTIWEGFQTSLGSIFRPPGQQQQQPQGNVQADTPTAPSTAAPNRPIVQAIQSNPIYQGVVNFIRPTQGTTKAPVVADVITEQAQAADKPAEPAVEGTNAVPVPAANAPVDATPQRDDKAPTQTIAPFAGPIQQMVQKNPIVQGISTAVQRIQNTIGGNTDKPREVDDRGFIPIGHGGHGGDNNDVVGQVAEKNETVKEEPAAPQEPPKTELAEETPEVKDEAKPSEVPAKTD